MMRTIFTDEGKETESWPRISLELYKYAISILEKEKEERIG